MHLNLHFKMYPKRTVPKWNKYPKIPVPKCHKCSSNFKSFLKLKDRLIISLMKIEIIYPLIPRVGTKKYINVVVTTKSITFIITTFACASSPFKILSIMMSTYIKGIKRENNFIY